MWMGVANEENKEEVKWSSSEEPTGWSSRRWGIEVEENEVRTRFRGMYLEEKILWKRFLDSVFKVSKPAVEGYKNWEPTAWSREYVSEPDEGTVDIDEFIVGKFRIPSCIICDEDLQ